MRLPPINFYYPEDINSSTIDPDERPEIFLEGTTIHSFQGYLRLKNMGKPVGIVSQAPTHGIVLSHADHAGQIPEQESLVRMVFLADRSREKRTADIWIVQNPRQAGRKSFHLIHWPQPGLIERKNSRNKKVKNVAYFGRKENLPDFLQDEKWEKKLNKIGLNWIIKDSKWWDYSNIDIVVGMRKMPKKSLFRRMLPIRSFWDDCKPASKLINAWHAGVPVILTKESSYRHLRKSPLDFLEADTVEQAFHEIELLKKDYHLYHKMSENGKKRALEYTHQDIAIELWRIINESALKLYVKRSR